MTPDLCNSFRRNADGSWTCTKESVLTVGAGQMMTIEVDRIVKPGELLGGYDLAAYLERVCCRRENADT